MSFSTQESATKRNSCPDRDYCEGNCSNCLIKASAFISDSNNNFTVPKICPDINQECGRTNLCETPMCPFKSPLF